MQPLERLKQKTTRDNLWLYILSLLKEKPMYAYELKESINKKFGFLPGLITPYKVLYQLEIQGMVKKYKKTVNKKRNYYEITERGKLELDAAKNYFKELINKL